MYFAAHGLLFGVLPNLVPSALGVEEKGKIDERESSEGLGPGFVGCCIVFNLSPTGSVEVPEDPRIRRGLCLSISIRRTVSCTLSSEERRRERQGEIGVRAQLQLKDNLGLLEQQECLKHL